MNVLMISPGFPDEMPRFASALAEVGASVYGVGDGPASSLPEELRHKLSGYLQVRRLTDEHRVVHQVQSLTPDAVVITAAMAHKIPMITKTIRVTRLTLIPDNSAASGLPPMAKTACLESPAGLLGAGWCSR